MIRTTCPGRDDLLSFSLGKLPDDASDQVARHLDDCPECRTAIETLSDAGDTVAVSLRGTVRENVFAEEPEWRQALAFIQEIGRSEASVGASGRPPLATVRDYRLLEEIGHGGMGTVYKAEHVRLKRIVALKLLPENRLKEAHAVARFAREMEAVGRLEHPHIVRAMDAGEHDGLHYLVMEFVPGLDLSRLVHRHGPLSAADACEIARQAAVGLQHAHEHGLIHRDVKPSNLMLTPAGEVKILDLGLALFGERPDAETELTNSGQLMGTVDYMAPEQADDSHLVDIRADIYSLGATLYKLLCGAAAFDGAKYPTPIRRIGALLTHNPQPIAERRDDVPVELAAVAHRMLARDPNDRFSTPAEVAAALAPWTAGADLPGLVERASLGSPLSPTVAAGSTEDMSRSLLDDTEAPAVPAPPPTAAPTASLPLWHGSPSRDSTTRSVVPLSVRPRRFVLTAAAAALALLGVLAAGAFAVRIATDKGELVIESTEPGVEVTIRRHDGQSRDLELSQGRNETTIRSGEYEVILKGADTDGLRVENNRFTLTRGAEAVVRIYSAVAGSEHPDKANGTRRPTGDAVANEPSSAPRWQPTPEQQAFFDRVAKLPAEEQVAAVRGMLMEVNPGFDGKVEHEIEAGHVVEIKFLTDQVTEIWPVRALAKLESLWGNGTPERKGHLSDLRPLAGMPLRRLELSDTRVRDLSPLAGMPLTSVVFVRTPIADLSPLAGMALTHLDCGHTRVSDLSPLRGMPLQELSLIRCRISDDDLALLQDRTELTKLNLHDSTGFSEEALRRCLPRLTRLRELQLNGTVVSDRTIASLTALPLVHLGVHHKEVSDESIGPLSTMRTLKELYLWGTAVTSQGVEALRRALPDCRIDWPPAPAGTWQPTPEQQAFFDGVAKLPAEEQVEAVRAKLMEVNPEFDGKVEHRIVHKHVTELRFLMENVTEIWPVRALAKLQSLGYSGAYGQGRLSDLEPLAGMPLSELYLHGTRVSDLSPLKGMPLTRLGLHDTQVSDFSPLQGMPLIGLELHQTQVSDLSPLEGMPLTYLNLGSTQVSDLSPLKGMPLKFLDCNHTHVSDLSPLKGMPLTSLSLHSTPVSDLSPLKGMPLTSLDITVTRVADLTALQDLPLTSLWCADTRISDLSPLAGMPLSILHCENTRISDLSPLKGMPLWSLHFENTQVSDLSPLKGIPLTNLNCSGTGVSDLSPLAGMPLTRLVCYRTDVSDLSPLQDMPLTQLSCEGTDVSDLSPLAGAPLQALNITRTRVRDLSPLRGAASLTILDCWGLDGDLDFSVLKPLPIEQFRFGFRMFHQPDEILVRSLAPEEIASGHYHSTLHPTDVFLKDVERRRKESSAFVEELKDLPPEKQLERVRERLVEVNPGSGSLGAKIEEGAVAAITLPAASITDITPLRALSGLRRLTITDAHADLYDLSPLNSLPLEELSCPEHLVRWNRDLLREMPTLKTINGRPVEEALAAPSDARP
ncbi:MAG: serine/threonine protein kinase [Planctomycetes bacterium]|nr:serine/threonine protein kinase [Planctomycetota bacterium]